MAANFHLGTTQVHRLQMIEVYSPSEVAGILKVSTKTVRQMLQDGEIKYFLVGKSKRIAEEDLRLSVSTSQKYPKFLVVHLT